MLRQYILKIYEKDVSKINKAPVIYCFLFFFLLHKFHIVSISLVYKKLTITKWNADYSKSTNFYETITTWNNKKTFHKKTVLLLHLLSIYYNKFFLLLNYRVSGTLHSSTV